MIVGAAYQAAIITVPLERFAEQAGVLGSWQARAAAAVISLLFALFPDVDTNSKAQDLYYGIAFPLDILLLWKGYIQAAAYLGFIAMLPIIGKHRGWTHSKWAMLIIPLPVLALPYLYNPKILAAAAVYYGAAVAGYFSHLLFDGLIWRRFRVKNF